MKQELSTPTSTANEAVVIVAITVEEEAIAAVTEAEVETVVAIVEARKAAILVVARKVTRGILISIQASIVLSMKDEGMMQSTAEKLHMTKSKKNKAEMDLNSQIGHINQALNATKCPQL